MTFCMWKQKRRGGEGANMAEDWRIVVLHGGVGPEREVSLRSGEALAGALEGSFPVELRRLDAAVLPEGLEGARDVVFPALHGTFGEDGTLQALLEGAGVEYCGSDAEASRLCMAKDRTKKLAGEEGLAVPRGIEFSGESPPGADGLLRALGDELVLKPAGQGSSVGLAFSTGRDPLAAALAAAGPGRWLAEERIRGRELTVGLLEGRALGVVEIVSSSGVYDYQAKYTAGRSEYRCPAGLEPPVEAAVRDVAEVVFRVCGCRDFARADFILRDETVYFLEINTLPGLTETSLLPKSASCLGLDFEALAARLVAPALRRFRARKEGGG